MVVPKIEKPDEGWLLPRTNDLVFKKIFGDQRNKTILKSFLKTVLKDIPEEEYEEIDIVDPHTRIEDYKDKECILDIKIRTKSKKIIDVEMQVSWLAAMDKRILYYVSDMIKSQIKSGEKYDKIKQTISIIIAANHKIINSKYYSHNFCLYDEEKKQKMTDLIRIVILELKKLPDNDDNTALWEWLKFLKTDSEEEVEMLARDNKGIQEATCVLKELSSDEKTRMLIQSKEKFVNDQRAREEETYKKGKAKGEVKGLAKGLAKGRVEGEAKGLAKGLAKGRAEGEAKGLAKGRAEGEAKGKVEEKINVARNAIKMGLSNEQISTFTELSIEEIDKLRNKLRDELR